MIRSHNPNASNTFLMTRKMIPFVLVSWFEFSVHKESLERHFSIEDGECVCVLF